MLDNKRTFFLLAGAGKSGSTAIAEVMKQDPDISFSKIKEPRFFVHQSGFRDGGSPLGPPKTGYWRKGSAFYDELYDSHEYTSAYGEASMAYFYCHETPELITSYRSDARLIFVLRDPVERIISHYNHERKRGYRLPKLCSMLENPEDVNLERYLWRSRYATHLTRYLRWFPPEQILVLEYGDFFGNTAVSYARIRDFLGLPERPAEEFDFKRVNEAREPVSRIFASGIRGVSHAGIGRWLSPALRQRGSELRKVVERVSSRPASGNAVDPACKEALSKLLQGEIERLEAVIASSPEILQGGSFNTEFWYGRESGQKPKLNT